MDGSIQVRCLHISYEHLIKLDELFALKCYLRLVVNKVRKGKWGREWRIFLIGVLNTIWFCCFL